MKIKSLFYLNLLTITHSINSYIYHQTPLVFRNSLEGPSEPRENYYPERKAPYCAAVRTGGWLKPRRKKAQDPIVLSIDSGLRHSLQAVRLRNHNGNHVHCCTVLSCLFVLIQIYARGLLF